MTLFPLSIALRTGESQRVRVAHIALQLDTGGMERLLVEFARHADRSAFDLRFVALSGRGRWADELAALGWPVTLMNARDGVRPSLVYRLARLFQSERIDVVHTHNVKPLLYAGPAARLAGVPGVVHTRHGRRLGTTPAHARLFRLATRCVDRLVCVSDDTGRLSLCEGVRAGRVDIIRNGIDLSRFPYAGPHMGGPAVFVGRLSPEKDCATLLRAFAAVSGRVPSLTLAIAGAGPCRADLERLAADLSLGTRVEFLGDVADVPGLLRRASLLILPSLSEGMPVAVLEAMASGLPVIATDVGGTPEVVDHGVTGVLVPPSDVPRLAETIADVATHPELARTMGAQGRRRVEAGFDVRTMVARYEGLYRDLCPRIVRAVA